MVPSMSKSLLKVGCACFKMRQTFSSFNTERLRKGKGPRGTEGVCKIRIDAVNWGVCEMLNNAVNKDPLGGRYHSEPKWAQTRPWDNKGGMHAYQRHQ